MFCYKETRHIINQFTNLLSPLANALSVIFFNVKNIYNYTIYRQAIKHSSIFDCGVKFIMCAKCFVLLSVRQCIKYC